MKHIIRLSNNPYVFVGLTNLGTLVLEEIWRNLNKSPMDDDQLTIHEDETDKAVALFAKYGFKVSFDD